MNLLVDIIAVAILALCIFFGYKRGLVGVAFKLFSFLIAVIVAFLFCKPVTNLIVEHTEWDETIQSQLITTMSSEEINEQEIKDASTPEMWLTYINQSIEDTAQDAKDTLVENSASSLAYGIINLVVILTLFIGTKLILWIVQLCTKFLTDLPILKQFNTLGGILFGILEGFFWLYVILAICSILPIASLQTWLSTSYLVSMLYEHNLILMLLF